MIFLRIIVFTLLIIGLFAYYANFGIPEIKPAPPPVAEELNFADMTLEELAALGGRLYNGKGTCTLCHNAVGGRAPLLDNVADVIRDRLRDPLYSGDAQDVEAYLYESMEEPSVFVVAGFGVVGTNDSESPMPSVSAGSIGFSKAETTAVVAYLQERWGIDITVDVPDDLSTAAQTEDVVATAAVRSPLNTPEEILAQFACAACHVMAGAGGQLGPDLSRIGATRDKDALRRAILDPDSEITEGFPPNLMPDIYAGQMYASELELIVQFLAGLE